MIWYIKTVFKEIELSLFVVNEIWYRVMLVERGCVKVYVDFDIVFGYDAYGCFVFVFKDLSL